MEKKLYMAPAIEALSAETEQILTSSNSTLTFDGQGGGSTTLQDDDLENGVEGLSRLVNIFGD